MVRLGWLGGHWTGGGRQAGVSRARAEGSFGAAGQAADTPVWMRLCSAARRRLTWSTSLVVVQTRDGHTEGRRDGQSDRRAGWRAGLLAMCRWVIGRWREKGERSGLAFECERAAFYSHSPQQRLAESGHLQPLGPMEKRPRRAFFFLCPRTHTHTHTGAAATRPCFSICVSLTIYVSCRPSSSPSSSTTPAQATNKQVRQSPKPR